MRLKLFIGNWFLLILYLLKTTTNDCQTYQLLPPLNYILEN